MRCGRPDLLKLLVCALLVGCSKAAPPQPQSPPVQPAAMRTSQVSIENHLWVLQPPDEMVEYDPVTFVRGRAVAVPEILFQNPDRLSMNRRGQMLARLEGRKFWFWDGTTSSI